MPTTAAPFTTNGACRCSSNRSAPRATHRHARLRLHADALLNNIELLGADPKKVEALIVSHGHFDHFGGLIGFLDKFRSVLPADLTLYAGGEDNFCTRHQVLAVQGMPVQGEPGLSQWGTLDRRELATRNVKTVLAENPAVIGHAFTTGKIKRTPSRRSLAAPGSNLR